MTIKEANEILNSEFACMQIRELPAKDLGTLLFNLCYKNNRTPAEDSLYDKFFSIFEARKVVYGWNEYNADVLTKRIGPPRYRGEQNDHT